jgi:hypothetical protein
MLPASRRAPTSMVMMSGDMRREVQAARRQRRGLRWVDGRRSDARAWQAERGPGPAYGDAAAAAAAVPVVAVSMAAATTNRQQGDQSAAEQQQHQQVGFSSCLTTCCSMCCALCNVRCLVEVKFVRKLMVCCQDCSPNLAS